MSTKISPPVKKIIEFDLMHYIQYKGILKMNSGNKTDKKSVYIKRIEYIIEAIDRALSKLSPMQKELVEKVWLGSRCTISPTRAAIECCCDLATVYRAKNAMVRYISKELGY